MMTPVAWNGTLVEMPEATYRFALANVEAAIEAEVNRVLDNAPDGTVFPPPTQRLLELNEARQTLHRQRRAWMTWLNAQ